MKNIIYFTITLTFISSPLAAQQVVKIIDGPRLVLQNGQWPPKPTAVDARKSTLTFIEEPKMVGNGDFEFIWALRWAVRNEAYLPVVVQVTEPVVRAVDDRKITMTLKLISPLMPRKFFKQAIITANAFPYSGNQSRFKINIPEKNKYYLMLLYNHQVARGKWSNSNWRVFTPSSFSQVKQNGVLTQGLDCSRIAISLSGPEDPILEAMKNLVIDPKFKNRSIELPQKILKYLNSSEKSIRIFAAQMAAAGEAGFSHGTPETLRDAYAQCLLQSPNPLMQMALARGYYMAARKNQISLPTNAKLLDKLFALKSNELVSQIILGMAVESYLLEKFIPHVRKLLADEKRTDLRGPTLYAMRSWSTHLKPLKDMLIKIVQNEPGFTSDKSHAFDRVAAFFLLREFKQDDSQPFAHSILRSIPSAMVFKHLVKQQDRAAIPIVLNAIEKKRYPMTSAVRLALILMCNQYDLETIGEFQTWWKPIRVSKEYNAMIRDGFLTKEKQDEVQIKAYKLVDHLGSSKYSERKAAKDALIKMGLPTPEALWKGTTSDDPEIELAAKQIIKTVKAIDLNCRTQLDEIANTEMDIGWIDWDAYQTTMPPNTQSTHTSNTEKSTPG